MKHERPNRIAVRVDADELAFIQAEAERLGVNVSDVVRIALKEMQRRRDPKGAK